MEKGKVYLVGAGPGDAGLLTRRAYDVIQTADVVLYDSLVGDAILSLIPDDCRKIAVGKRAGNHLLPQEETNVLLLREALNGNCVVRLKGGDPFLFGRGGEELELLAENDVAFEVIPGVTSAIAVPAYNGIPVTHRDWASSVHIITAHRRAEKTDPINYKALVEMGGTFVFLMGVRALPEICAGLMEAGMPAETPAAVLERGTTAAQRRVVATVQTLSEESEKAKIGMPAIIVVGEVCRLSEDFAWAEQRPLAGEKILLMRPRQLIREFAGRLREKGAEVLEVPLIETRLLDPNPQLDAALASLNEYQWLVFTSPSGVRLFFEALTARRQDLRSLMHCRIAVIGEGSRRELEKHGFIADFMPENYTGEDLGRELSVYLKKQLNQDGVCLPGQDKECPADQDKDCMSGQDCLSDQQTRFGDEAFGAENLRILIPRAKEGNPELTEHLKDFTVEDLPLYETVPLEPGILDLKDLVQKGEITIVVFTSASMVRSFVQVMEGTDLTGVRAACIGKQTAAAAEKAGMQIFVAEQAKIESLEKLIQEMHG
ncbi:MAG: uroporphyrinogen-III C-methyltransferase [Eubacterium sp.]|nr:uroporphyrinogen-III C-methyltransferase [Eubacterium sp.]